MKLIKQTESKEWMFVTNLKAKRSIHSSKSKRLLHGEEQPQQWREGPKRVTLFSGWKRGEKRGRMQHFYVVGLITVGSWLEPTVIDPNHCRLFA